MAKRKTFIGGAFISITGDKKGLDAVLSQVREGMQKFGRELQQMGVKFMAVGAAIQAPLTLAVKRFAELGSAVADASARTGLGVEAFSELAYVAKLSGADASTLEKALKGLAKTASGSKDGMKAYTREFDKLGISVTDSAGNLKGIEQLFMEVGGALGRVSNETERAAIASNLLGRAGGQLLPMFQLGTDGIEHYRKELRRLGGSMSPEMAGRADRLGDMMDRLKTAFDGIVLVIGDTLAPMFDKSLVRMTNLIANVREYLSNNPQLITGLQQIAIALTAIGAAMVGIGTASRALSVLVSPGGVLLALAGILVYISGALDPLIEKWGKAVMGFEVGGRAIRDWLSLVAESFRDIWQAVKDAASQLRPALEPALSAVKWMLDSIWQQIQVGFMTLKIWIVDQVQSLIGMIQGALEKAITGGDLGPLAKKVAQGYANILGAASSSLAQSRVADAGWLVNQRAVAAGARKVTGGEVSRAGSAIGSSFGGAFNSLKGSLGALGEKWSGALAPLMETVFGQKGAEGGVKSFFDIFQGLGRPFDEWTAKSPTPGPALQAAMATSGTFSGLGARQMGQNQNPLIKIGNDQLTVLKDIREKIGGSVFGGEEF